MKDYLDTLLLMDLKNKLAGLTVTRKETRKVEKKSWRPKEQSLETNAIYQTLLKAFNMFNTTASSALKCNELKIVLEYNKGQTGKKSHCRVYCTNVYIIYLEF